MTVMEFENEKDLGKYCAEFIESLINKKNRAGDFFTLALSGGKSPISTYEHLAMKNIDWKKTFIFLVDERYVGHDDINSNFKLIKETLLDKAGIPYSNIVMPDTTLPTAELAASDYEKAIRRFFNPSESKTQVLPKMKTGLPEFDLVCLGIGDDGHTASLFPGGKETAENEKWVVNSVAPDNFPVKDRISLTFPFINKAKNVMFIVSGKNKGDLIKKVLKGAPELPASRVKPAGELMMMKIV
jgi:6-phosphogluconolactonase